MARIVKSLVYITLFGGGGYAVMTMAPDDEQKKRDMMSKNNAYAYHDPGRAKAAGQFTNVLLATATSKNTIYGAKSAKEQRLQERAKETD
ncbi:unnamed protein product [Allacma fusca]|uniref:Uncharacterized protein n=1 Tax=Allacma fusca TaxID=39272 RepID=A0A8J2KFK7_9HEXA|nr:unnamed protein product [Allacma fusca]